MGMFNKKSDSITNSGLPLDQVIAMKGQGYSNNQIIQSLQRDGYSSSQIYDAISQSELTASGPIEQQNAPQSMSMQSSYPQPQQQMPQMQQTPIPQFSMGNSSTEEIVEAIIDEKWNELVKDINKVIDWKQKADSRLTAIEQQMNDMKDQFDKLHQAIIGKIGEYDKNILEVGAELQAMEKVFAKVLPSFVDNVSELNRITEKMRVPDTSSKKKSK